LARFINIGIGLASKLAEIDELTNPVSQSLIFVCLSAVYRNKKTAIDELKQAEMEQNQFESVKHINRAGQNLQPSLQHPLRTFCFKSVLYLHIYVSLRYKFEPSRWAWLYS